MENPIKMDDLGVPLFLDWPSESSFQNPKIRFMKSTGPNGGLFRGCKGLYTTQLYSD